MRKYITLTAVHAIPFLSLFIAVLSPGWATAAQAALTLLLYLIWSRALIARVEAALRRDVEPVRGDLDDARAELALIEPVARRALEDQRALRARVGDIERNITDEALRLLTALQRRARRTGALTEEQQIELVRRYARGESVTKLALDMNVSERTVQNVLHRFRKR